MIDAASEPVYESWTRELGSQGTFARRRISSRTELLEIRIARTVSRQSSFNRI